LGLSCLLNRACRLSGREEYRQTHHPNAEPRSWLRAARRTRMKKPHRSGAKFDHRACRCDNGKPTDTIPQPVAQRMCRRLITRFISRDVTIA